MVGAIYLLFFCSGFSGLVYQVVWVREFGNVFGNTIYSASLVIAIFMLGLGTGSVVIGTWADRRYSTRPNSLLRTYGYCELLVALLGSGISLVLPHLGSLSAATSAYTVGATGWHTLSTRSYVARGAIAVVLLVPITLVMGGTLTLLIRHLVRRSLLIDGMRIAMLYGLNTAGAAVGCFLTDFILIPAAGLRGAQFTAAFVNALVAAVALFLAGRESVQRQGAPSRTKAARKRATVQPINSEVATPPAAVVFTSLALGLTGFSALGMEILWFRHFTLLLGGFRAVFSLVLTAILTGVGLGSLLGGILMRRTSRPALWLMGVQALVVASTLGGLTMTDMPSILAAGRALAAQPGAEPGLARAAGEVWLNLYPILIELGGPALLMGFSFPLANAVIQHAERSVGRRAGILYLANTIGAVCGSLVSGFLLLPLIGIQHSATILMLACGLAIVLLYAAARSAAGVSAAPGAAVLTLTASLAVAVAALGLWIALPSTYVIARAQMPTVDGERLVTLREGVNEVIAITDVPGEGRQLLTNGHPMSSTNPMSQRYMRALAHIPLLLMDRPETALVIGFGVGETVHAATLHPSLRRVEVADLSTGVLEHASYFRDTNKDVLKNPRVTVYVNDGRQHLRMKPPASYDLITLEPPPIALAGVGALYSREFYELARTRLKAAGYISQWLPAYQVSATTTLALVRAFVDVFPNAVLLSGADAELLLVGTNASRIEVDPKQLLARLNDAPAVAADLRRIDLGTPREIIGTFVGGPQTLAAATRVTAPVTDDRPLQEYGAWSRLSAGRNGVPASLFDVGQVASWCPKCYTDGRVAKSVDGLDAYLALLASVYHGTAPPTAGPGSLSEHATCLMIQNSHYLSTVVPDAHQLLGIAYAADDDFPQAVAEFREQLRLAPKSATTHWNLGDALASSGLLPEAIDELRTSLRLDPSNDQALSDLAATLLNAKQYTAAAEQFRALLQRTPTSSQVHNNLGIALASDGRVSAAIAEFQEALRLQPGFVEAQRNLTMATGVTKNPLNPHTQSNRHEAR